MRLLIVSRGFWPLAGEKEMLACSLAKQLADLGNEVTVVSAGVVKQWPNDFQWGRVRVHRISLANRLVWAATTLSSVRGRWIRALQRWLSMHSAEFDGAIAIEFPEDQMGVTKLLAKSDLPVVVRLDKGVSRSFSREISSMSSSDSGGLVRFVCNCRESAEDLRRSIGHNRVCLIEDGVDIDAGHDFSRSSLRESLASAHAVLSVAPLAPFAICSSAIQHGTGIFRLVQIWPRVLTKYSDAKLWLIGDGSDKDELFQRICELNLREYVILPGEFDEIRDVLRAANMFIIPGQSNHSDLYAKLAMALGLPLICHRCADLSRNLRDRENAFLFDDENNSLSDTILQCIGDVSTTQQVVDRAREEFAESLSIKTMAEKYMNLFARPTGDLPAIYRSKHAQP